MGSRGTACGQWEVIYIKKDKIVLFPIFFSMKLWQKYLWLNKNICSVQLKTRLIKSKYMLFIYLTYFYLDIETYLIVSLTRNCTCMYYHKDSLKILTFTNCSVYVGGLLIHTALPRTHVHIELFYLWKILESLRKYWILVLCAAASLSLGIAAVFFRLTKYQSGRLSDVIFSIFLSADCW